MSSLTLELFVLVAWSICYLRFSFVVGIYGVYIQVVSRKKETLWLIDFAQDSFVTTVLWVERYYGHNLGFIISWYWTKKDLYWETICGMIIRDSRSFQSVYEQWRYYTLIYFSERNGKSNSQ